LINYSYFFLLNQQSAPWPSGVEDEKEFPEGARTYCVSLRFFFPEISTKGKVFSRFNFQVIKALDMAKYL
jgi:hypothetical protein